MNKISSFTGKYHFLSNFHPSPFVWENIRWPNVECAFQAAKSLDVEVRKSFASLSPSEAKRKGRRITLRPDWEEIKYGIMYELVKAKFEQSDYLRTMLLQTGEMVLEEGNTWNDRIWGICPPNSGQGKNALGKILMIVREELKSSER